MLNSKTCPRDAKPLYGLLLDHMSLSAKNSWYGGNGRVYIYQTTWLENVLQFVLKGVKEMPNIKRVICLYRVSTLDQVEKNDIPMQQQCCHEKCITQKSFHCGVLVMERRFFIPIFKERVKMSKQKKPYVKPEMTIIPAGSPKYNEIMALLKAEDAKAKE